MKGKIYRRIRYKDYSLVSLERSKPHYGAVCGHPDRVIVEDAEFVVSEPGRQRVLAEQQKNVHAYVKGVVHPTWYEGTSYGDSRWRRALETIKGASHWVVPSHLRLQKEIVLYDPYEYETFTTTSGDPIYKAAGVVMHTNGLVEAYVKPEGETE